MHKGLAALCGLTILSGLLVNAPLPRASAKAGTIDKELLGIRLLQSYKSVLQLYGQPTRIFRIDEMPILASAMDANGKETGGIKSIEDSSSAGGSAGGGSKGMPGSGGPMGMPGSGGPMGMPGSGGPMRMPGSGGKGGPMGMPGSGGSIGGTTSNEKPETFAEAGGFIWVYFYAHDELAYVFFFNGDGRVEMITEHGRYKGKPSTRGIHLGDPVKNVYNLYGWPDTVEPQFTTIALIYNIKHHVLFNVLNGKVTAISVILKEDEYPHLVGAGGNASGGAPGTGRPGSSGGGGRSGGGGGGGNNSNAAN